MKVQQKVALVFIRTKLKLLTIVNEKQAAREAFRLFCTPLVKFKPRSSPLFNQAESLEFAFENKKISGFRFNYPSSKKVLILHGFSSTCHNFHQYIEPLIGKGYEVLAFDAPAHGLSEGTTINAMEYAGMIREVIRLYGPVDSFLAHSFGGIAICLAMEDITHNNNTKIVLIAPATETTSAIDNAFNIIGIKGDVLKNRVHDLIKQISGKETSWFSVRRAINNITASVLWIHDEDDDTTPVLDALKVKDDAPPNVRFIITKGLGHRRIYKDNVVRNEVISFL